MGLGFGLAARCRLPVEALCTVGDRGVAHPPYE